jgi:hypothetical protein
MKNQTCISAYCYRNGVIKFSNDPPVKKRWKLPKGALPLATGPEDVLREIISAIARESYPTKRGGTDTVPLVPGVPEAADSEAALDAVDRFVKQINARCVTA